MDECPETAATGLMHRCPEMPDHIGIQTDGDPCRAALQRVGRGVELVPAAGDGDVTGVEAVGNVESAFFEAAEQAGVQLRFEAAVAGVVPVIRVVQESFGAVEFDKVAFGYDDARPILRGGEGPPGQLGEGLRFGFCFGALRSRLGVSFQRGLFGSGLNKGCLGLDKRLGGPELIELAAAIPIRTRTDVYELADVNRALADLAVGRVSGAAVLQIAGG